MSQDNIMQTVVGKLYNQLDITERTRDSRAPALSGVSLVAYNTASQKSPNRPESFSRSAGRYQQNIDTIISRETSV